MTDTDKQRLKALAVEYAEKDADFWNNQTDATMLQADFIVSMDGAIKNVRVLAGTGGPHIRLDTERREVQVSQSNHVEVAYVSTELCDAVIAYWSEAHAPSEIIGYRI